MSELTVTHWSNRADHQDIPNPEGVAFGYVEFSDGSRLPYTNLPEGDGVMSGCSSGAWLTDKGSRPGEKHRLLALRTLVADGVKFPEHVLAELG